MGCPELWEGESDEQELNKGAFIDICQHAEAQYFKQYVRQVCKGVCIEDDRDALINEICTSGQWDISQSRLCRQYATNVLARWEDPTVPIDELLSILMEEVFEEERLKWCKEQKGKQPKGGGKA